MFGFGPYSYMGFMKPEFARTDRPSLLTGVGRTKGRPPDKAPRYALQKARTRTRMKKGSRRRNRK